MLNRQQKIVRTGYVGIITNVIVACGKAGVGILSQSMAILLDAVNNLSDALSSALTIIGVKLAGRPADDKHPFGYGRIEYFTAVIISALILVAGATSLVESIKGIIEPQQQEYTVIGLCVIAITLFVKFFLGVYTKRKGKELSSDSLISSGSECIVDCIVSVSTLISAGLFIIFGWEVDSWLAALISCLIIKTGIEMMMSPVKELLGKRSDANLVAAIKACAGKVNGVRGVYDVVIHNYGPEQNVGALHVEVDDTLTASDLHQITRQIQIDVRHDFGIFVTVGFYARHQEGTAPAKEEAAVRQYVTQLDGVLGMHGFYVNHTQRVVSFDIVYSFKIKQPLSLRQHIKEHLKADYADYEISIGLDRNYSAT